ncbi:MAG: HAD family hydrolase [Candidatus Micrarchaeota archaeon]|nr:HAD family hydrolase [Candidatus Micrarchaeota archaeon]
MSFKWVCFDWRNTLVDGRKALRILNENNSVQNILRSSGFSFAEEKYAAALARTELEKTTKYYGDIERHRKGFYFTRLCFHLGKKITWENAEQMDELFLQKYVAVLELLPGALETLEFLKTRGTKLAIISNAREARFVRQMSHLNLASFFDVVVTSFEVGGEKSSLKPFEVFLEKANVDSPVAAGECIMVGDRPDEDGYAKKLGFYTVLFNPFSEIIDEPDLVVRSHGELLGFFKEVFPDVNVPV